MILRAGGWDLIESPEKHEIGMIILIVLIAFRIALHLRLQADDRLQGKLIIFDDHLRADDHLRNLPTAGDLGNLRRHAMNLPAWNWISARKVAGIITQYAAELG